LGALACLLFCTRKTGWGWDNFLAEADAGSGPRFPKVLRQFMVWGAPALILLIYIKGYYDLFAPKGMAYLVSWLCVAALFLTYIAHLALSRSKDNHIKVE